MTLTWILKATCILGAALAADESMRRRPASWRFAVWAVALAALLALPLVEAIIPQGNSRAVTVGARSVVTSAAGSGPTAASGSGDAWLQAAWLAGLAFFLLRSLMGYALSLRRAPAVPMTVGVWRPRVLLPASAGVWSADLLRSVMLHEAAHIARRDPLWNLLAQLARAVYWFHPLVWLALHRLHAERERACDDAVLAAGVKPSEYAAHLLACARSAGLAPAAALPMANRSHLSHRVEAVLSPTIRRGPVPLPQRIGIAAVCFVLLVPLAAFGSPSLSFRSHPMYSKLFVPFLAAAAMAQSAELSGRVYDASNATVPNANVIVRNRETATEFKAVSGGAGEYRLAGLPAGTYDFEVLMPGFARYQRRGIKLADASVASISTVLSLGEVQESLQVTAPGQARPQTPAPQRILVGGSVRPVRLLRQVKAVYPESARAEGREGNVVLRAVIGVDGNIVNVNVLPGADADLGAAAEQAVRQWQYEPTLLNGKPVETVTTVEMNFRLGGA